MHALDFNLFPEAVQIWAWATDLAVPVWAGWTQWPPDVPSSFSHSVVLCFSWEIKLNPFSEINMTKQNFSGTICCLVSTQRKTVPQITLSMENEQQGFITEFCPMGNQSEQLLYLNLVTSYVSHNLLPRLQQLWKSLLSHSVEGKTQWELG